MPDTHNELLLAFREDHAQLGRGFHDLSERLRVRDGAGAKDVARRLDEDAGAHIAFEERDFYPLLAERLGRDAVDRMYEEHGLGLRVVEESMALDEEQPISPEKAESLLRYSETMESHIAECGAVFSVMLETSPDLQQALYRRLVNWRERRPRWTVFAREEG